MIALFQEIRKAGWGRVFKAFANERRLRANGDRAFVMIEMSEKSRFMFEVKHDIKHFGARIEQIINKIATFKLTHISHVF